MIQVWSIRVDLHFLNDEGNMLDCASIAAITALRHFRRPDVTVIGEDVTIVSVFSNLISISESCKGKADMIRCVALYY